MKFVFFAPVEQQHAGATRHFNPGQPYELQEHEAQGFIRAGLGRLWDEAEDGMPTPEMSDAPSAADAPPLTENQKEQLESLLAKRAEKKLTENQAATLAKLQAKAAAHAASVKE